MSTKELLAKIGVDVSGQGLPEITGLSIRADDVKAGDVFAAMKGLQKDGADFVLEAVRNGAVLVLAERPIEAKVPVIIVPNLRQKVSELASLIYPSNELVKVAVTGTNGKTSTVFYVQQLLNKLGISAASLGTIGVDMADQHVAGSMTTPDAVTLNKTLHGLQEKGVRVVAMEASSHGLDQGRLNGLHFLAGAFTNLTQDHLDYHKTMDAYLQAKSKLFSDCLSQGAYAVLNADDPYFAKLKTIAESKGEQVVSYGWKGETLALLKQTPSDDGQDILFRAFGKEYQVHLNIVGDFQVMNLFAAMGLCLGAGAKMENLIPLLSELRAPTGRIEQMGTLPNGAQIFVDYAHTPDAVERVLTSLRAHTKGKLVCLMGCGGNRDTTKRPLMGAAAAKLADKVYITDDNPRFEDPATIRAAIKEACPNGIEMDNREEAIHKAVEALEANDVLVLAGKGHEPGQTINGVTYAMDDRVEARLAILNQTQKPIWQADELALALSAKVPARVKAFGISIDTRTLKLGDLFIALIGDKTDGHAYVKKAVELGAAVCVVNHLVEQVPPEKQIVVSDTMEALETLAKFARMRSQATFIGITGSSGKTTTKEMLRACLSGQGVTHATAGNFNNQIGVPLTLAALPVETKYAIIEMGMNHHGELMHLSDMVRPDVTIITSIGSAHREFFASDQDIAVAKSEIFDYQNRQGTAVLNRDSQFYEFLKTAAEGQGIQHHLSFGSHETADIRLVSAETDSLGTKVCIGIGTETYSCHLNFYGTHFALDALGVLAVVQAVGGNVPQAIKALEDVQPAKGRGGSLDVVVQGKKITLIDDAYNANPMSMAASISALGLRPGKRKVAVLGDMLELGDKSVEFHVGLLPALKKANVDKVYTVGPLMQQLWQQLPADMQGKYVMSAPDLIPILEAELQENDVVLVKASHGTGLDCIIQALKGK